MILKLLLAVLLSVAFQHLPPAGKYLALRTAVEADTPLYWKGSREEGEDLRHEITRGGQRWDLAVFQVCQPTGLTGAELKKLADHDAWRRLRVEFAAYELTGATEPTIWLRTTKNPRKGADK